MLRFYPEGMRAICASALIIAAHGIAGAQSVAPDYSKAYSYALRCFVAGGAAMPKADVDTTGTALRAAREHTRKAFDTVYFMGRKLGYADARISADLDKAQAVEMRLMVQSPVYLARTKTECVTLGLM